MAGAGARRVVATCDGTVSSKEGGLGGKVIYLDGDNGWRFYYAHLSGWAVRSGRVKAGQLIAYVGATGNAAGGAPHLHFQMWTPGGSLVNPYSVPASRWSASGDLPSAVADVRASGHVHTVSGAA